jgi:putative ABC transport system permease protein
LQIDGEALSGAERELAFFNEVSSDYFETLGTPLLVGDDFNAQDTINSPKVALVNESFAKTYFHGLRPTGRRYRSEDGTRLGEPIEIIGLVRDVKYLNLREDFRPTVYVAADQNASPGKEVTFELRIATDPATMIKAASLAVDTVDPRASIQFRTLAAQVDESLARERLLATLSGFFGGLALLLAMIGLYGVTSYSVTRRQNEIGVRIALGAQQSRVLSTIMGEVMILTGIGLAIGLPVTIAATHFITSLLYRVTANDPWTISVTATMLAMVAAVAGFLPAHRASLIDPMSALREE